MSVMSQYEQDDLTMQFINKAREGRTISLSIGYLAENITSPTEYVSIKFNKDDAAGSYVQALLSYNAKDRLAGSHYVNERYLIATFGNLNLVIDRIVVPTS